MVVPTSSDRSGDLAYFAGKQRAAELAGVARSHSRVPRACLLRFAARSTRAARKMVEAIERM